MPYSDPAAYWTDQTLAGLEQRTSAVYEQAWKEMQAKLEKRLENYQKAYKKVEEEYIKGKITYSELQAWEYRQTLMNGTLGNIVDVLAEDMHNANLIAAKIANGGMADIYAINANYGWYDIIQQAKDAGYVGFSGLTPDQAANKLANAGIYQPAMQNTFTLYNHDTAEKLLKAEWSISPEPGKNGFLPKPSAKKKKELKQLKQTNPDLLWNEQHFRSAMLQGILQGESMPSLAKRLQGVCFMNERQAIRNARTMTTNVQNQGRQQAYLNAKDKGVNIVIEWYATLDGKTRHSHRLMHGKTKSNTENGKFPNGCRWPGDPNGPPAEVYNCRCTTVSWVKGFEHHGAPHDSEWLKQTGLDFDDWQKGLNKPPKTVQQTAPGIPIGSPGAGSPAGTPQNDMFSAQRKANARRFTDIDDAHRTYLPEFEQQWANLTEREQYGAWEYTRNSNPINKSLSGYHDSWSRSDYLGPANTDWGHEDKWRHFDTAKFEQKFGVNGHKDFKRAITDLTTGIDKCALQEDAWFVRGGGNGGLAGLLSDRGKIGMTYDEIYDTLSSGDPVRLARLKQLVEGETFQEHAFLSTGSASGGGFSGSVHYDVYAPKGTKAMYVEPTSYYGQTVNHKEALYKKGMRSRISGYENETLFQRGSDYRITKFDFTTGGDYNIEMEVVGQPNYFKYGDEDTFNGGLTRHKK